MRLISVLFLGIACLGPIRGYGQINLRLDSMDAHDMALREESGGYAMETVGGDPWVWTVPLEGARSDVDVVLTFEYFCPEGLDHLQVFAGYPPDEKRSRRISPVGLSEGWTGFSVDLSELIDRWGKVGDRLRLDFGSRAGVKIQIRNLGLRGMTEREREIAETREAKEAREAGFEAELRAYLAGQWASSITDVSVGNCVVIKGSAVDGGQIFVCEIAPCGDVTGAEGFVSMTAVGGGDFIVTVPRFIEREGTRYDRAQSRWVLVKVAETGREIVSHARYADRIEAGFDVREEIPAGRKGLGGFSAGRGHVEDLDALGISSATVNIWITGMMYTQPGADRLGHDYHGKFYYFDRRRVERLDETLRAAAVRNIVVAAILLVGKAEQCPDPEIGRLLQHPDMDPAGIYSMPNMTTAESVNCYAAALDFLASRYSRPDKEFGRIHHWIMHNEVDAGWVWTNMGEKPALVFMDAYVKSMRLCYNIARTYNAHAEVMISLTHHWAWTSHPKFYPSKDLLEILLDYTRAEGDFEWGVAYHPYPESLFEPKTWLDQKARFEMDTPLITFKNLEVLDWWIKLPETQYMGVQKRTLWLSENGTNSKTYSEQDLREQAAGFAFAWKKMGKLDGIDGFQWHNWFDNRGEGGLRIGLRRFPDDDEDPGGCKPVWFLYEAAGTDREDAVFAPYKAVIGIEDWD